MCVRVASDDGTIARVVRLIPVMTPRALMVASLIAVACRGEASGQPSPGAPPTAVPSPAPAPAARSRAAVTDGRLVSVAIASRVGDHGPADSTAKRALTGERVTLYAVIELERAGAKAVYSDAPSLRRGKRVITPRPLAEAGGVALVWSKIEPTENNLSNTATGSFRYEAIPYAATRWDVSGGAVVADVHPTLTPDHGRGLGTMRYALTATLGDTSLDTPGITARRTRAAGGLTDAVHRVTIRKDDTFIGYLTEMFGQPYIWASAGPSDSAHQSEHLEGSDCADLMVYGARRAGLRIPYGWTGSLKKHARVLGRGALAEGGVYRDRHGDPVPFPEPGDLILFPRHVGALTVDRGTPGVVDVDDLMIHTLFDSPKEQALRDSGYADNPIEILRWGKR
jgi:hypothetical protein